MEMMLDVVGERDQVEIEGRRIVEQNVRRRSATFRGDHLS